MNPVLRVLLQILGIGVLVAGGLAVALAAIVATVLLGPLIFWLAWNVLNFASAVGLPELGFWAILLATLFLVVGWAGKVLITGIVFLVDPTWNLTLRLGVLDRYDTPEGRKPNDIKFNVTLLGNF